MDTTSASELPDPGPLDVDDMTISYGLFGICGHHGPLEMVGLMRQAALYLRRQVELKGRRVVSQMRTDVVDAWQVTGKDREDMPPGVERVIRIWCRLDQAVSGSASPPPATSAAITSRPGPATSATPESGGTTSSRIEGTGSTEAGSTPPSSER